MQMKIVLSNVSNPYATFFLLISKGNINRVKEFQIKPQKKIDQYLFDEDQILIPSFKMITGIRARIW